MVRYVYSIEDVNLDIEEIMEEQKTLFRENKKKIVSLLSGLVYTYHGFFIATYIDFFHFSKNLKTREKRMRYYLILSFSKNKLFANLKNIKKKNYFSISSGLFIKFFEKKKSFKKNKTVKLLIAKFIRKIFLISKINNMFLIVKHTPTLLLEILNFLNTPIAHKFTDPVTEVTIDESINEPIFFKFFYFVFKESKDFSLNKKPQRGRVKRKVLRKIVMENRIVD